MIKNEGKKDLPYTELKMENEKIIYILKELWQKEYPHQSKKRLDLFYWRFDTIRVENIRTFVPKSISKAKRYLELIKEGVEFPPVVVAQKKNSKDGFIIIDGYHRMWAYKKLNIPEVNAYIGTLKKW